MEAARTGLGEGGIVAEYSLSYMQYGSQPMRNSSRGAPGEGMEWDGVRESLMGVFRYRIKDVCLSMYM